LLSQLCELDLSHPLYRRTFGRASMLSRLKLKTPFFLAGLEAFDFGVTFCPCSFGAISIGPSATAGLCFLGERSTSPSFSSSDSTRRRFLLGMPCGTEGIGGVFSLFRPGKAPGILLEMILRLTWRTLDWPGDDPNPLGDVPKLIVWSLRKVKVPGTDGGGCD